MALPLSPELLAAQTAQSRKPIIEVIAGRLQADFPFLGNSIANPDTKIQGVSFPLFLPSGALAIFYAGEHTTYGSKHQLRYIVTDAGVNEFSNYVAVDSDSGRSIAYIDGLVMADGNIGLVVQWSTDVLSLYRISPAGVKLSETQITGLATLGGASVVATDTGYALISTRLVAGVYSVNLRTSADFVTWSSSSPLTISGIDSANEVKHPRVRRLADDSYLLLLAYIVNTVTNVVAATSSDLSNWSAINSVTASTEINLDYSNPSVLQRKNGSLFVSCEAANTYLEKTTSDTGWDVDPLLTHREITPTNLWFDAVNNWLYLSSIYSEAGPKHFIGTCRIDTTTWEIDRFYGSLTTPATPPIFGPSTDCLNLNQNGIADGMVTVHANFKCCVSVIDYINDTIRTYYFTDQSEIYGPEAVKNVNHDIDTGVWGGTFKTVGDLCASTVHGGKLWLAFFCDRGDPHQALVGYIDLSQQTAPYEFAIVNTCGGGSVPVAGIAYPRVFFYPDDNIALVCSAQLTADFSSPLHVVSLTEDATIKCYHSVDYPSYPKMGVTNACMVGGSTIYAVPYYGSGLFADEHKWGLMEIDLANDLITYYYPPWLTSPGNWLGDIVVDESAGELHFRTASGVAVFNFVNKTWTQIDNTNMPGLPPTDPYSWTSSLAYDAANQFYFYGDSGNVYLVPRSGVITSVAYSTNDGSGYTAPTLMAAGYDNTFPGLALSPADEVYATWTDTAGGTDTVSWDKTGARKDITELLTGETLPQWGMNRPGQITFTVANGHLFDPYNPNSTQRQYLAKGRDVTVRIGELVNGVKHWAPQGTYLVTNQSIKHQRGNYPLMQITAQDQRYLWELHQVPAITVDQQTPEEAIVDIITEQTPIAEADIAVPVMPLSFEFDAQWLDQTLADVLDDIVNRFQHFVCIDMNGKVTVRPITLTAASSLTVGKAQTISFCPNDDSSDLSNRITVTGESLDDFEVTYDEEKITSINGTVGWYGYKNDFHIDYSDDRSARYKDPRLEVVESATGILFHLAGKIKERISEVDPDNKYCVVKVEAPNLIPVLVAAIAVYAAGNMVGDVVVLGGTTIPLGRKMEGIGLMLAMMVLGSTGNFQYTIHGRPVGYIKRSYQASADDIALQQELGQVVESKIEGFLCHTPDHCQTVADFEMAIAQAERKKTTVEMITHLQNEIGDTITVTHPYTGYPIKLFVTRLQRSYKPATIDDGDGHLLDTVEGWVL